MLEGQMSDDDAKLLEESTEYLGSLIQRLNAITPRLSADGRWAREINKAKWFYRKNDLIALELELFEWTQRLDLRLVGLPQRLRNVTGQRIPAAHPLNQRFELARKVTAAAFFLHSIGWVHKSIQSQNIIVIEEALSPTSSRKQFPHSLGRPYLLNFQWARSAEGDSDPQSRTGRGMETEIYRHPDRQGLQGTSNEIRYSMMHDIYSLGVVLLELGLWRPLDRHYGKLLARSPTERRDFLVELSSDVGIQMGTRCQELVVWCLRLDSNPPLDSVIYATNVLEKLEDLVSILS
ncbi:uncharacterized protein PAC_14623 [Phialocephala subalpina]|uniref:Protein kinase domain-containing protein n=1 Tax=Phialocephala subalpina TaxID=576137 RepID=A0A1L7XI71_9HELO|nr:uncharacterized protein PAC_14623 [Phialocephala subalpina]